ncbi:hypothetical protein Scep_012574 [Stephania cephalantha]|uniref:Uncharacterized protein n=1 Tax=Stephania cephalantha TaxID=152367 RepID=A0AAP0P9Z3_9MAGN
MKQRDNIEQKCTIQECHKKFVFRLIEKLWRNWKSMLSTKLAKGDSPLSCKPLQVKEHEWNEFVQVSRSLEWKQLSMKMRKMRSKVMYPHTLSRKSYARLEHDLLS